MAATSVHQFAQCITCHSWSPDHSMVALCPNNNEVHIYKSSQEKWERVYVLQKHDQIVCGIDWSARSNRIVTASHDRNSYVWNHEGTEWVPTLVILRLNRAALCVQWSPKENKFAVGSGAKTVCICYYEQDNNWWVSKLIRKRHDSSVTSVAWHPNNILLATTSTDGKCRVFSTFIKGVDTRDPKTSSSSDSKFGEQIIQLDLSFSWAFGVKWSPSGNTLAYVGHNSMIYFVDEVGPSPLAQSVAFRDLPLRDVLFVSEKMVIGVGFDCNPMVFAADERGIWSFIRFLGERKSSLSGSKYGSQFSEAFGKFYGQSKIGGSNDAVDPSRSRGGVHENCINSIVPLREAESSKILRFSTSVESMDESLFSIRWHHGGNVKENGGCINYIGGSYEVLDNYDSDKLSRIDLLWIIREKFKYQVCGPLYYQKEGKTDFTEIVDDASLWDMMKGLKKGDIVDVFVDSVALDGRENMADGSHKADDLSSVANMVIKTSSTTCSNVVNVNKEGQPLTGELNVIDALNIEDIVVEELNEEGTDVDYNGVDDHNEPVQSDDKDGSSSGSEAESNTTDDELYNAEVEDDEANERDEEGEEIKNTVSRHRRERSRRNRGVGQKEIELREAGPDIGFDDWLKKGNNYGGLLGGDEDYIGSSDADSFASDDEEGVDGEIELPSRRRNKRIHYDPNCEETLWELGMIFENVEQYREAITKYTVKKGVQLTLRPNDQIRVRAKCLKTCTWHLFASKQKRSQNFLIKTYYPVHTCYRTNRNRHCNTKFLTTYLKQKVVDNPGVKIWQLQEHVKTELEIYVGKTICRKVKTNIMKELMGDYRKEFERLYDYRDEILRSNPGSTCVVHVDMKGIPPKCQFRGFYICFAALKKGFKEGCRKCVGLDGTFLKGICKGVMLVAVGKDGNHQIYPIAWAVVDAETKATWKWFINLLQQDLGLGNGDGSCVVTDMQKGLIPAIQEELPNAEHRMCGRHVLANWAKKWRGVERRQCF